MLSYNLTSYERAFTFRILSQDSAIKDAITSVGGSFVTRNGWSIQVARSPEIKVVSKRIYLRGSNKANDKRLDRTWNISSNFKLHQYLNQIDQALAEIISFAQSYKDTYKRTYCNCTYPLVYRDEFLPRFSFTSEVETFISKNRPVRIDAQGWGNNKLKDIPTWESRN